MIIIKGQKEFEDYIKNKATDKAPAISFIASSVRSKLWKYFFGSLAGTSLPFEVIFAGNLNDPEIESYEHLVYIRTKNIKPAQCYEVARRAASGELIHPTADDAQYFEDCIGKAYYFWKSLNNEKAVLSILTQERYEESFFLTDLDAHTIFGPKTPLMAPFGLMSRAFIDELGGYDNRYICGQYENDMVMRILQAGGVVVKYEQAKIIVDHFRAHGGVATIEGMKRPFAKGYPSDRVVLSKSWAKNGIWIPAYDYKRFDDKFQPYCIEELTEKSQGHNIGRIWID